MSTPARIIKRTIQGLEQFLNHIEEEIHQYDGILNNKNKNNKVSLKTELRKCGMRDKYCELPLVAVCRPPFGV